MLAAEIREFLISAIAKQGGHLGPNLGAVELTIALHRAFDSPTDRIVWDTGQVPARALLRLVQQAQGAVQRPGPGRRRALSSSGVAALHPWRDSHAAIPA